MERLHVVGGVFDGGVADVVIGVVKLPLLLLELPHRLTPRDALVLGALHEPSAGCVLGDVRQEVPRPNANLNPLQHAQRTRLPMWHKCMALRITKGAWHEAQCLA